MGVTQLSPDLSTVAADPAQGIIDPGSTQGLLHQPACGMVAHSSPACPLDALFWVSSCRLVMVKSPDVLPEPRATFS